MRFRWTAFLVAMALVAPGPPARASDLPAPVAESGAQRLYLELVLNGSATDVIVPAEIGNDRLSVDAAALRSAGVAVEGTGSIELTGHADMAGRYDADTQRLLLDVSPALLPRRRIGAGPRERVEAHADTGFLLGYDALLQRGAGDRVVASLWSEQRLFGAWGVLSNTGVVRAGAGTRSGRRGYLRYDTSVQMVDEQRMTTVVAGDVITGTLPGDSPVRLGGVQVARSFRVRPDLLTMPLPAFEGQAAVPSSLDLLVNGSRAGHHEVAPGRFVLNDLPAVNGAGDLTVVTTDAVGRQVATSVSFYVAPELLRPGLVDFSLEAGRLRNGYGRSSFGYGALAGSGTLRRGLTTHVTGELHAEASQRLSLLGGGLVVAPGRLGTVRVAATASRTGAASGYRWVASYAYVAPRFTVGLEHVERQRDFTDLASFDLASFRGARRSDRASLGTTFDRLGSLGVAYAATQGGRGRSARFVSASWSMQVGERLSAFAGAGYDAGQGAFSGQFRLSMPLGRQTVSAGLATGGDGGATLQGSYSRAMSSDGGLGIALDATAGGGGTVRGQAQAIWRNAAVQVEVGANAGGGRGVAWVGAGGALIAMAGGIHTASAVPNAFAVVSTGLAGVPVRYENQLVGVTGRSGTLLVPAASAYHEGRYEIDAMGLPAGMITDTTEQRLALRAGTGAVIRLPVRSGRSAIATLVGPLGEALGAGDVAVLPDGTMLPIGWGGELMLEDAPERLSIDVRRADASVCRATIAVPVGSAYQRLEAAICA